MKQGDRIFTPRFCSVHIEQVFDSIADAMQAGYKEPTYYDGEESADYDVLGKSIDMYHMTFAACKRERRRL